MGYGNIKIIGEIKEIKLITSKGFSIFLLEIEKNGDSGLPIDIYPIKGERFIKVKGFIGKDIELLEGYNIQIEGKFEERDENYVRQGEGDYIPKLEFNISFGTDINLIGGLDSLSGLKAYLVRYIPGIGEKQVSVLLDTLKIENIIEILDGKNAIGELVKVRGIGQLKAETIKDAWDEGKVERNILIDLGNLGLSINKCSNIYNQWGIHYKKILDEDPYRLTEIKGIGFTLADEVAMKYLNISEKDPRRYAGVVEFIIRKYAEDNGDSIISTDSIKEGVKDFISNEDIFKNEDISIITEEGIKKALEKKSLYKINEKVYSLGYFAYMETQIAKQIEVGSKSNKEYKKELEQYVEKLKNTEMTTEQIQAVDYAFSKKISIILGGAGTGKTYTVGKIIEGLTKNNEDYFIVTPTNKAAARVKEVSPYANVSTIHSLLKIIPGEEPEYNIDNPLPYRYLIIDETSMLDNNIANKLLNAINFNNTTLIFVGDPKQLPPVGAGSFFYDINNSGVLDNNITLLSEVKRADDATYKKIQEQGYNIKILQPGIHNIVANSLNILEGKMPISTGFDCINYCKNFTNKEHGERETLEQIKKTYSLLENKGVDVNKDFQLYIPTYKGNLGISKINNMISELINPNPIIKLDRGVEFRIGDKIIYNENDKELNLTKGDTGIILNIEEHNNSMIIDFFIQGKKEIKGKNLDNIGLGYAISVHKAQGTEIKYGGILLVKGAFLLLSNQLLYTAYTRCKEKVFLFGDEEAYKIALKTHINIRNTLLFHLLSKTPLHEIYPNISRKQWGISENELNQIKNELVKATQYNKDDVKILKIKYADTTNRYSYYRYLFGEKKIFSQLNLFENIELKEDDINKIEGTYLKFLRIKKYNKVNEKRGIYNKVINNGKTYFIEINSYNKDIKIS